MSASSSFSAMRVFTCAFGLPCLMLTALTTSAGAQQDQIAAFYRGRTVQAVVGYTP